MGKFIPSSCLQWTVHHLFFAFLRTCATACSVITFWVASLLALIEVILIVLKRMIKINQVRENVKFYTNLTFKHLSGQLMIIQGIFLSAQNQYIFQPLSRVFCVCVETYLQHSLQNFIVVKKWKIRASQSLP